MPICITCSTPVKNLYTTYSKADDRSAGKGVRLTQCPHCKRFADKYVEHDYVVLFIDLVLIKPQVYRHLLFNRLGRTDDKLDPSILRLGILLILFDVYITWARIERSNSGFTAAQDGGSVTNPSFSNALLITQYLFFLTLNVVATLAQHGTVRLLVRLLTRVLPRSHPSLRVIYSPDVRVGGGSRNNSPVKGDTRASTATTPPTPPPPPMDDVNNARLVPLATTHSGSNTKHLQGSDQVDPSGTALPSRRRASPAAISTALLVSSCTKLFPILLVIWPIVADDGHSNAPAVSTTADPASSFAHRATSYIGWIVLLNNIEALIILLDCGYLLASLYAVTGVLARWLVEGWLLGLVGLVRGGRGAVGPGYGDGPIGDLLSLWDWFTGSGHAT